MCNEWCVRGMCCVGMCSVLGSCVCVFDVIVSCV